MLNLDVVTLHKCLYPAKELAYALDSCTKFGGLAV